MLAGVGPVGLGHAHGAQGGVAGVGGRRWDAARQARRLWRLARGSWEVSGQSASTRLTFDLAQHGQPGGSLKAWAFFEVIKGFHQDARGDQVPGAPLVGCVGWQTCEIAP
jgi:hypothetical protein